MLRTLSRVSCRIPVQKLSTVSARQLCFSKPTCMPCMPNVSRMHTLQDAKFSTETIPPVAGLSAMGPAQDASMLSGDFTLHSLLNSDQKELLRRIKTVIAQTIVDLRWLGITKQDVVLLRNANEALDELFLVVVVGEFNSGKSNFINALLGAKHCKTGVLPTTETVQILRYGEKKEEKMIGTNRNIRSVTVPIPWLRQANLVDTPGTNAVLLEHQEITEKFVPNADIILFVTSVERPFSNSEKEFLSRIHTWKKKVLLVLNKADLVVPNMEVEGLSALFKSNEDVASKGHDAAPYEDGTVDSGTSIGQIQEFVKTNSKTVLGEAPPVFGVSSRLALDGKLAVGNALNPSSKLSPASQNAALAQANALLANSGFVELEQYILSQLTAENKIKLKMSNPQSLMEQLLIKYEVVLENRVMNVCRDVETRELMFREIQEFTKEVTHDFEQQQTKIDNIFLHMKQASSDFINKQVRLSNVLSLATNRDKLQQDYIEQVHRGVSNEIDDTIRTLSSWLVSKTSRQAHNLATIISRTVALPVAVPLTVPVGPQLSPIFASSADTDAEEMLLASTKQHVVEEQHLDMQAQAESIRSQGIDFQNQRLEMIRDLHQQCASIVAEDKRVEQTQQLVRSIHNSVLSTAAMETAAASLGAVFTAAFFDITGLAGAGALATVGLVILPTQRTRLNREMGLKLDDIHSSLRKTLQAQYLKEIEAAQRTLMQSLGTFNRFVSHEEERLEDIKEKVAKIREEINIIHNSLNQI